MVRYRDREDAGRQLARAVQERLSKLNLNGQADLVVLALPRGGVPVAVEVAREIGAELDLLVVRKLGMPWDPEFAFGAIAAGGARYIDQQIVAAAGLTSEQIEQAVRTETAELLRRESVYLGGRARAQVAGKTAILVDDGIATGATMQAAILALRQAHPSRVVLAVPVAPTDATFKFADLVEGYVCPFTPDSLRGVGEWYSDFSQVSDQQVISTLHRFDTEHVH